MKVKVKKNLYIEKQLAHQLKTSLTTSPRHLVKLSFLQQNLHTKPPKSTQIKIFESKVDRYKTKKCACKSIIFNKRKDRHDVGNENLKGFIFVFWLFFFWGGGG